MEFLLNIEWAVLAKIVLLDIVLGGDNAVVIAMACAAIPLAQRSKAIFWGTAAAVGLRIVILAIAAWLINIPFLKLIAGAMLVWIGIKLLLDSDGNHEIEAKDKVWDAVKTIAIADLVMSIDNVFAVTGAAQGAGEHGLAYAIFGIILSIPIIVFGATFISKVMDRFPIIIWFGAALLGWVGGEMMAHDAFTAKFLTDIGVTSIGVSILAVTIVILAGYINSRLPKLEQAHD